ncbi:MAG: autotransporter-associated beta strand repeat-containing protein [Chthoniobacteraceae bacterium]
MHTPTLKFSVVPALALSLFSTFILEPRANASTYTWSGAGGANWSGSSNWTPNVTGTTGPGSADTVYILDAGTTARTIYYDSGASGTLGALNITQTSSGTNTLRITRAGGSATNPSLLITSSTTTLGGGSSSAVSQIIIDASKNQTTAAGATMYLDLGSTAGSGTLTINAGGLLTLSAYFYNSTAYTANVAGNINIDGGTLNVTGTYGTISGNPNAQNIITGNVVMTSGLLNVAAGVSGTYSNRLLIQGNFSASSGTVSIGSNSALSLNGATNTISGSTVVNNGGNIFLYGTTDQTFSTSAYIGSQLTLRASGNLTRTISSSYAGGVQIAQISFGQAVAGGTTTMKLGSNLTTTKIAAGFGTGTSSDTVGYTIDLAGYSLGISGTSFAPSNTLNTTNWNISNSAATGGTFSATSFDFSTANNTVNVGVNSTGAVVLSATGNTANNLGTSGTINPTSTFAYTGSASTLYSGRTIGRLSVGNGSAASALSLATGALSVGGDVTVATSGTLNLAGLGLTEVASSGGTNGGLNGNGTVINNTSGTATLTLDTTNGNGSFSGVIKDGTGVVALTKNGTGTQVLSGSNSYTGATTVTGGTLTINGSLAAGSTVSITAATLAGSGTVGGSVSSTDGTLNGSGLSLGATTLKGTSTLKGYNIASSVTVASGTTTLSGTTKSTSALSVSAGATLNADGTIAGSATVGGLLKGNSTITGNLTLTSGTLAPGNSAGITKVQGNFSTDASSTLVAEVSGTDAGTSYDQVQVSGNVTLAGTLDLSTLSGLTLGSTITLIDNTGSGTTTGYFVTLITSGSTYTLTSNSNYTFTVGSTEYLLSYTSSTEGDGYSNDVTLTVVPEPSTWAMVMGGIGMLAFGQRLRHREVD